MKSHRRVLEETGHLERPVGFHKGSKEILLLKTVIDKTDDLHPLRELDTNQQKQLIIGRWNAGEWNDLYIAEKFIDLERALKEVEEDTEIGRRLIQLGIRGVEMLLEDIEKHKRKGKF